MLPVSVHTKQNRFALDALWEQPANFVESIQVKAAKLNNSSGEYIAAENANQYQFNTQQAELSIQQRH